MDILVGSNLTKTHGNAVVVCVILAGLI